jgi:hypothetical protein
MTTTPENRPPLLQKLDGRWKHFARYDFRRAA